MEEDRAVLGSRFLGEHERGGVGERHNCEGVLNEQSPCVRERQIVDLDQDKNHERHKEALK